MTADDFDASSFLAECERDLESARAQLRSLRDQCQGYRGALLRIKGKLTPIADPPRPAVIRWCTPNERG